MNTFLAPANTLEKNKLIDEVELVYDYSKMFVQVMLDDMKNYPDGRWKTFRSAWLKEQIYDLNRIRKEKIQAIILK